MNIEDFFAESLIPETQRLLNKLINPELVKYHIETMLKKYGDGKFDAGAIELITTLCVENKDMDIYDVDFFKGTISFDKEDIFRRNIFMVNEFEIYAFYLLQPSLSEQESTILEEYVKLMNDEFNGYGLDKVEIAVAKELWDRFKEGMNVLSKKYVLDKFNVSGC